MEQFVGEALNIRQVVAPASAASAALPGDRISTAGQDRVAFLVDFGTSTGAVASVSLLQHNAASAGTSKALAIANPYFKKVNGQAVATKVVPSVAADTYDLSADFAGAAGIVVFEVLSEDLDTNGGFSYVSLQVNASSTAKVVGVVALGAQTKFKPAYSNAF